MIGLTFGGIHSNTYGIVAKSINRPILPSMQKREQEIQSKDGTYDFYYNVFDKRIIEVELSYSSVNLTNVSSTDRYDYNLKKLRLNAREIAKWLYTYSSTKTLKFDDEDKFYNARVLNQVNFESLFSVGKATVQFECEPFAYNTASTTYSATWTANTTSFSVTNLSNVLIPFTITISGTVTNPIILLHDQSLTTINITSNITSQILTIDNENYKIKLNNTFLSSSFTFFELVTGLNSFSFTGTNPNAVTKFSWIHRWL